MGHKTQMQGFVSHKNEKVQGYLFFFIRDTQNSFWGRNCKFSLERISLTQPFLEEESSPRPRWGRSSICDMYLPVQIVFQFFSFGSRDTFATKSNTISTCQPFFMLLTVFGYWRLPIHESPPNHFLTTDADHQCLQLIHRTMEKTPATLNSQF